MHVWGGRRKCGWLGMVSVRYERLSLGFFAVVCWFLARGVRCRWGVEVFSAGPVIQSGVATLPWA